MKPYIKKYKDEMLEIIRNMTLEEIEADLEKYGVEILHEKPDKPKEKNT